MLIIAYPDFSVVFLYRVQGVMRDKRPGKSHRPAMSLTTNAITPEFSTERFYP
jgi:hypothetical protein